MKMTVGEIIKKSSVEDMAKIIGSVIAMHIDGISAEEATKMEYKETLKVLQSEMEVDYQQTNADRIRHMSDEELTEIIMCPYDTVGKPIEIMPCVRDGNVQELVPPEDCKKCMMEWLLSEVEG